MKMDPNTAQTQSELTAELDRTVKKSLGKDITVFIIYLTLRLTPLYLFPYLYEVNYTVFFLFSEINIAGGTTAYVNRMIEKNLPYV